MTGSDQALLAWTGFDGTHFVVRAMPISRGRLGTRQVLSPSGTDAVLGDIAAANDGRALALWRSAVAGADPVTGQQPHLFGNVRAAAATTLRRPRGGGRRRDRGPQPADGRDRPADPASDRPVHRLPDVADARVGAPADGALTSSAPAVAARASATAERRFATEHARRRAGRRAIRPIRRSMRDPEGSPCRSPSSPGPPTPRRRAHVLDAYRAALDRAPLLVVPTAADVERYRRELAAAGAVFGVEVLRFGWLEREVARRGRDRRAPARPAGPRAGRGAAVGATRLDRLARSAATPGFLPAFLALADELEEQRITPGRWYAALRAWARRRAARSRPTPRSSVRCTAPTATASSGSARRDARLHTVAALDRLRLEPARWGGTPVFLYGFDDLTPLQRDTVETLAVHCRADVTLSLTYEPGRAAFAGRGATFQELLALGADHVALDASADHYASLGLHHLERGLFETGAEPGDPGGGVLLLEGGGERAELELVAAHAARLIREEGFAPEEIAVVLRTPDDPRRSLADVFAAAGVPIALSRDGRRRAHRARPRGDRAAALRAARRHARRPARVAAHAGHARPARRSPTASRREARQNGARTAAEARALWEAAHPDFALSELDRVADAHARGFEALCERVATEASALFAAPHRGRAPVLTGPEALDARVAGALRGALGELGALAARAPSLAPSPAELARTLEGLEVFAAGDVRAGARALSRSPRRCASARAACGRCSSAACRRACSRRRGGPSRSSATPSAARSTPRRACAWRCARTSSTASASSSTPRCRGRPTCLRCPGTPPTTRASRAVRSLFVDDVLDLLDPVPDIERRALGAAGFDGRSRRPSARSCRERLAAQSFARRRPPAPIAPLRDPAVLAALRERETWSASALEAWTALPGEVVRRPPPEPRGARARPRAAAPRRARAQGARGGACARS